MGQEKQALQTLSALLQLGREAARTPDLQALSFLIVNDTHRLIRYDRALLWRMDTRGKIHFQAASGTSRIERNSPYMVWLRRVARFLLDRKPTTQEPGKPQPIEPGMLPDPLKSDWGHWLEGSHPLYLPLLARDNRPIAGCWLEPGLAEFLDLLLGVPAQKTLTQPVKTQSFLTHRRYLVHQFRQTAQIRIVLLNTIEFSLAFVQAFESVNQPFKQFCLWFRQQTFEQFVVVPGMRHYLTVGLAH